MVYVLGYSSRTQIFKARPSTRRPSIRMDRFSSMFCLLSELSQSVLISSGCWSTSSTPGQGIPFRFWAHAEVETLVSVLAAPRPIFSVYLSTGVIGRRLGDPGSSSNSTTSHLSSHGRLPLPLMISQWVADNEKMTFISQLIPVKSFGSNEGNLPYCLVNGLLQL